MSASLFELIKPGMVQQLGSHTFTADEIIAFAQKYDPQPFHLSQEGGEQSHFGALCACGWHTASMWMRCNVEKRDSEILKSTGYTGPKPEYGPSPGIRNVRWLLPVFVGDTISYSTEITGKRKTPHRPGWGMVFSKNLAHNQHGKLVMDMQGAVTMRTD